MSSNSQTKSDYHLLSANDPIPVEIINPDSRYPVILVSEHAGNLVPSRLTSLGLSSSELNKHIAWDIGAEKTARLIAKKLGATLVLQRYSRLVIDCNRPPDSSSSILVVSDGIRIDGNQNLAGLERKARVDEVFMPFQQVVANQVKKNTCKMVLSIHSFTRTMNGFRRPWDIGFLFRHDELTSNELMTDLSSDIPRNVIGMNEPYQIDDEDDWFVPKHGEASGKFHSLIEICNDQIDSEVGQLAWADKLAMSIDRTIKRMTK